MTWLERICGLVAERPDGAKVDIPAIVRAMTPTQAHIVTAITVLIERGELDARTLRRPIMEAAPQPKAEKLGQGRNPGDVDGKLILAEIDAFIAREGIPRATFSRQCLGDPKFVGRLVRRNKSVRRASAEKIRAFIAERDADRIQRFPVVREGQQPLLEAHDPGGCAPPVYTFPPSSETPARSHSEQAMPPEPEAADDGDGAARLPLAPSPIDLYREVRAFLATSTLTQRQFGRMVMGSASWLDNLRRRSFVRAEEVERAAEIMADPALKNTPGASGTAREAPSVSSSGDASRIEDRAPYHEPVSAVAPTAPARPSVDIKVNIGPRRDPTQPPETPIMDAGDRAREASARHGAAIKRGQEREAAALLDRGIDPSTQGSLIANLMRAIQRRRIEEARLLDPVEQAKTILRKRFAPVVGAEFADPPGRKGTYLVGRRIVSQAELLAMAGIAA